VEAAQGELLGPRSACSPARRSKQLCVSVKMSFMTSRIRTSSGSLSASFLGRANEALDLVLVEPPQALCNGMTADRCHSKPWTIFAAAVASASCCRKSSFSAGLRHCSALSLLLFDRNKVPDQAVLDKEGLRLAGLPQRRGLVQCRFLLVLLRQVSKPDVPARSKTVAAQRTEQHMPLRQIYESSSRVGHEWRESLYRHSGCSKAS
jgi:hypothetical protein